MKPRPYCGETFRGEKATRPDWMICAVVLLALIGISALFSMCSVSTKGTPYESTETCLADKHCSERFLEYLDCTARFKTGCDR